MQTSCLSCRKHTDNIGSRKVIMTNQVIRKSSKCGDCLADKSRFLKKKSNKKSNKKLVGIRLILNYLNIKHKS